MLPALVRSPIAARISGTFRILSWIGILKTSKWGTGKITSAETQEIMPGEVISVALLPFMIIAEVLEGWEAFAKPAFMQHLIFRIADVQKSFETDPQLKDIGMLEKSTYLITNSLLSHRAFAFFHSLLMISLLCGLTLSLIRRGFVSRTPLSAKLLVVLGAFLAAFGVARHTLPLSSILKHGPYVAIVLREIAVNGFDPCHSHQAWSMMFQALASLLTAAVLCADFGGLQGVEAAMNDGKNGAQLAALIVLAISSLVSILRATRKRRDADPYSGGAGGWYRVPLRLG
eukprot:GEMP01033526.1.p1 GENE.GEMP01033526.1~~GEMP01033526.1.p1  ORF type:complete len:287 (+),score=43.31 GEMP01033526.1:89-949(+)